MPSMIEIMNKKNRYSIFTAVISIALIITWVSIIFWEIVNINNKVENDDGSKVILPLDSSTIHHQSSVTVNSATSYTSILIDDDEDLDVSEILELIPENVAVGLSIYNKKLMQNIETLKSKYIPYLIKLPLTSADKNQEDLALQNNMTINEIEIQLKKIYNKVPGSIGFYNMGDNSNFLYKQEQANALIKKIYSLNSIFLYGINNQTPTLEPYGDLSFAVNSSDINITGDDYAITLDKLKLLESIAIKQKKAIGVVNSNTQAIAALYKWCNEFKNKNVEIVPIKDMIEKKLGVKNVSE